MAVGSGAVELGVGYVSVIPSAKGFQKELDKQLNQASSGAEAAGQKVGKQMSSGMAKALKIGGAAAGAAAVAGIGLAMKGGLDAALNIDAASRSLTGLHGSAETAADTLERVGRVARDSSIDHADYAEAAKNLAYIGVEGEQLESILDNAGKAIVGFGGDGSNLERVNDSLAKMVNNGKVNREELLQLSGAGIPVFEGLSKHLGVTVEEMNDMVSKGMVGIEDVLSVMEDGTGDYFGQLLDAGDEMEKGLGATWARLKDNLKLDIGEAIINSGVLDAMVPALDGLADALVGVVGWTVNDFIPALQTAGEWVRRNRDWIAPLAVAIGAAATAWGLWVGAIKLWQTVTKIATGIQAAFNAVMAANPIMLIVIAIAALVAGLVYFFTQTETGQRIWESFTDAISAGWEWVKEAFAAAWDFIQPVLQGLGDFFSWVGEIIGNVFSWMIENWQWVVAAVFGPLGAVVALAITHWDTLKNAIQVVWDAITSAISWAWHSIIMPVWNAMQAALGALGSFFQWVWTAVIQPVWNALGAGIAFVWNSVIMPVWNALKAALQAVGAMFQTVWNNVIKPAWDALGNGIRTVINNVIMPAWDVMKRGLDTIKNHFSTAVSAITSVWDTLSGALRKPIDFLINVVWNRGLVPAWNTVQGFLPGLPRANPMPGFATGGAVSGPGTGTSDSIIAKLSAGEHVLTAAEVRAIGGQGVVYALRAFIKEGRPFTFDGRGGLAGLPRHLNNRVGDLAGAAPDLLIPRYAKGGEVRPAWEAQLEAGHAFAQKIAPAPYVLGGSSGGRPGGPTDCSGFMSEIADVILGGPGGTRKWATGSFPGPQAGAWASGLSKGFSVGIVHGGPAGGHTAGTLSAVGNYSAVNVESGGGTGQGATYGGAAVGADHGQFPNKHHLKIGADGAFESAGGPSPAQQLAIIKKKIKEILDKALEPIKVGMAQAIGSPPPPYLDIPPQGLTRTKDTAVDTAFGFAEKLGDKLRSVYDTAKNVTASITGLFRDKGGFIPAGKSIVNNETGKPEAVLNWDQLQQVIRLMESAAGLAALQEWAHGDPTAAIAQGVSEETVKAVEAVGERIAAEVAVMTDTFEKTWREGMLEDALGVFGVGQVGGTVGAAMKALADPDLLKPKAQDDSSNALSRVSTALPGAADFGYENTTVDLETRMPDLDTSSPGSGPVKDQVREAFSAYGWDKDPYWAAVDWIVGKESTWNPTARNPSSGAFGLFQFLGGTKQQYLPDENTNPKVQGAAGAKYIKDRYGDPLKAKAFWEQNGWYDRGGWLKPGVTLTRNDTGKPEAILNPAQWSMISRQIDVVEQMANGASGATYNVYATDVDEAMKRLQLREAQRAQTYMGAR